MRSGGLKVHMNLTDANYLSVIHLMPTALSPKGGLWVCGVSVFTLLMCLFVVKIVFTSLRNWKMIYNADLWRIKPNLSFLTESVFVVPWQGDICFAKVSDFVSFCLHNCNHFASHTDYILFKSLNYGENKDASDSREVLQSWEPYDSWRDFFFRCCGDETTSQNSF